MIQGAYIKGCLWTQAGVLGESPSGLGGWQGWRIAVGRNRDVISVQGMHSKDILPQKVRKKATG